MLYQYGDHLIILKEDFNGVREHVLIFTLTPEGGSGTLRTTIASIQNLEIPLPVVYFDKSSPGNDLLYETENILNAGVNNIRATR